LKIIDHISIYFLIAGTYTPFLLGYLNNSFGITLLAVLWGLDSWQYETLISNRIAA
jgi:hemolysin III